MKHNEPIPPFQELLQQYQQWLEEYHHYAPYQQATLKEKYQTIQQLVTQMQQLPDASHLENPALVQALQAFWQAVVYAQALLTEEL